MTRYAIYCRARMRARTKSRSTLETRHPPPLDSRRSSKVGRHWRRGIHRHWIAGGALAVRPAADRTTRTSTRTTRSNSPVAPPYPHIINPAAVGPTAGQLCFSRFYFTCIYSTRMLGCPTDPQSAPRALHGFDARPCFSLEATKFGSFVFTPM